MIKLAQEGRFNFTTKPFGNVSDDDKSQPPLFAKQGMNLCQLWHHQL